MATVAPARHGIWRLIGESLPGRQLAALAAGLVAIATLYCQVYCASASHPMHGAVMPLHLSLIWAIGAVIPWLVCFELNKRIPSSPPALRWLIVTASFASSAAIAILLERGLDQIVSAHTRPLEMQMAAQLPAAALVGLLLAIGRTAQPVPKPIEAIAGEPLAEVLAIARTIDWVEAAGNYVQVHARGRTILYRATMRELESTLDSAAFLRIHRSTIVALAAVEARVLVGGSPAVRLRDGTLLKVGDRYAPNLDALAV